MWTVTVHVTMQREGSEPTVFCATRETAACYCHHWPRYNSEAPEARPEKPFCNYTSPSGCCLLINIYKVLEAPLLNIQIPTWVLLSHEWSRSLNESHDSALSWPKTHKGLGPNSLGSVSTLFALAALHTGLPLAVRLRPQRQAEGLQEDQISLLATQKKAITGTGKARPCRIKDRAAPPWPDSGGGVLLRLVLGSLPPPLTTPLHRSSLCMALRRQDHKIAQKSETFAVDNLIAKQFLDIILHTHIKPF